MPWWSWILIGMPIGWIITQRWAVRVKRLDREQMEDKHLRERLP